MIAEHDHGSRLADHQPFDHHIALRAAGKTGLGTTAGNADQRHIDIDLFQHFQSVLPGKRHVFPVYGTTTQCNRGLMKSAQFQCDIGARRKDPKADIRQVPGQRHIGRTGIQKNRTARLDQLQCLSGNGSFTRNILPAAFLKAGVTGMTDRLGAAPYLHENTALLEKIQIPMDRHQADLRTQFLQLFNRDSALLLYEITNFILSDLMHSCSPDVIFFVF